MEKLKYMTLRILKNCKFFLSFFTWRWIKTRRFYMLSTCSINTQCLYDLWRIPTKTENQTSISRCQRWVLNATVKQWLWPIFLFVLHWTKIITLSPVKWFSNTELSICTSAPSKHIVSFSHSQGMSPSTWDLNYFLWKYLCVLAKKSNKIETWADYYVECEKGCLLKIL